MSNDFFSRNFNFEKFISNLTSDTLPSIKSSLSTNIDSDKFLKVQSFKHRKQKYISNEIKPKIDHESNKLSLLLKEKVFNVKLEKSKTDRLEIKNVKSRFRSLETFNEEMLHPSEPQRSDLFILSSVHLVTRKVVKKDFFEERLLNEYKTLIDRSKVNNERMKNIPTKRTYIITKFNQYINIKEFLLTE